MNNRTTQAEYQKLENWMARFSIAPKYASSITNESSLIVSTGDIVGRHQDRDFRVAAELQQMKIERAPIDETASKLMNSPANVIAILSTMAMTKTEYVPQKPLLTGNVLAYNEYVSFMKENPLLYVKKEEGQAIHYEEENYSDLIEKVVGSYDGIAGFDKAKLKDSTTNLLKAIQSHAKGTNVSTVFTQGIIDSKNQDEVLFSINTTNMEFDRIEEGRCKAKPHFASKIEIQFLILQFNMGSFDVVMAEKILNASRSNLDDWLNKVKTKPKASK